MDNRVIISNSTTDIEIKESLIEIIDFQLKREVPNPEYPDLLLWMNVTNGYVSCHWYNFEEEENDEDDTYSALELPELFEKLDDEEKTFDEYVLNILKSIKVTDFDNAIEVAIYQTWEINDPELLLKLN